MSRILAGPWAGQLLGDYGADVVKIERPGSGDDTRHWGPPWLDGDDGESAYFLAANRNKRSVTVNIADEGGQQLIRDFIQKSDVLLENYKVGTLARFGLGPDEMLQLNPRLVYCSICARGGSADLTGLIDDYAFAVHGLLELYTTTQEVRYLSAAIELAEHMIAHFWDDEGGGFYLAPDDGEQLIVRAKESYDGAIPAGNSVAILDLLWLARITAQPRYDELAARAIEAFGGRTSADPSNYTQLMAAVDFIAGPSFEIVVAGGAEAEDTRAMLRALHHRFRPNKVVLLRPEGDEPAIAGIAPYTADQTAVDGKATAYVCRDFACRAPTTEIEVMLAALELPASADAGNAPKEDGPKKDGADGDGGDDGR